MPRTLSASSALALAISAALVAVGVAVNDGFAPSVRTLLALGPTVVGLVGVARSVRDRPVEAVRLASLRWWLLAFAAGVPYGLATAPADERAAAVGDALAGPAATALEAAAGAAILCAVTVTVIYGFARYGIHPGRPTPEERIL